MLPGVRGVAEGWAGRRNIGAVGDCGIVGRVDRCAAPWRICFRKKGAAPSSAGKMGPLDGHKRTRSSGEKYRVLFVRALRLCTVKTTMIRCR